MQAASTEWSFQLPSIEMGNQPESGACSQKDAQTDSWHLKHAVRHGPEQTVGKHNHSIKAYTCITQQICTSLVHGHSCCMYKALYTYTHSPSAYSRLMPLWHHCEMESLYNCDLPMEKFVHPQHHCRRFCTFVISLWESLIICDDTMVNSVQLWNHQSRFCTSQKCHAIHMALKPRHKCATVPCIKATQVWVSSLLFLSLLWNRYVCKAGWYAQVKVLDESQYWYHF